MKYLVLQKDTNFNNPKINNYTIYCNFDKQKAKFYPKYGNNNILDSDGLYVTDKYNNRIKLG